QTISFPLTAVIKGWQIGVPLLKQGGEGLFFIPSELGYGSQGTGSIPGNSVLIFDIGLADIN
ncbi:MAG: peptidylprolyl isomerase, partial [Bacteroidetes bacterium 4484_249]